MRRPSILRRLIGLLLIALSLPLLWTTEAVATDTAGRAEAPSRFTRPQVIGTPTPPVTPAPPVTPTSPPGPQPTPSPTRPPGAVPTVTTTPEPDGPGLPGLPGLPGVPFDPFAGLQEHLQRAVAELLATTIRPIRDAFQDSLDRQWNILTVTRPEHSIGLAAVQQLHGLCRAIANGAFALILIIGGYNRLFRHELTGHDSELWPLLGRLVAAALAVNTALIGGGAAPEGWLIWFIRLNNGLISLSTSVLPISLEGLLQPGPVDPLNTGTWIQLGPSLLLTLVILAVLLLVLLLWVLQMLARLALLTLLLALVPLALVLWVLPQTETWARLWWRLFLPVLFCQFLQVTALGLATALSRSLAQPTEPALAPVLSIAALLLVLKIPGLLAANLVPGYTAAGSARQTLVLASLVRRLGGFG